ncbi:hypothetical protein NO559_07745 [Dasania sp. GY-MA-18]|uniref:Uncharacterized protein n=1 Tax=Dasania phycosphaerae TaxID=2950436 RepID=A0A9J6RL79_9GAMM|nr:MULTISPECIES: hypothetical protein [Dasania]MCR8922659.1 hypothetical protein [Dasania sp. GY-MA-18]MCZ0865089.1 hypothetical protein [Dasania phycosphaerae]MCZ0868815.1 hypothetical protein [Dasania phycosphaerae]
MDVDLKQRMNDLVVALSAAAPGRTVSRDSTLIHSANPAQLAAGIFVVISQKGGDYRYPLGRPVADGRHFCMVVGRLEVNSETPGQAVEDGEFDMLAEVVSMVRRSDLPATLDGMQLVDFTQSSQADVPVGWVGFTLKFEGA